MNTKPISRHIGKRDLEQNEVIEEEYRSLIRVAEVISRSSAGTTRIETPLGDFMFYGNDIKEVEN